VTKRFFSMLKDGKYNDSLNCTFANQASAQDDSYDIDTLDGLQ
jgi:hypothetical protein